MKALKWYEIFFKMEGYPPFLMHAAVLSSHNRSSAQQVVTSIPGYLLPNHACLQSQLDYNLLCLQSWRCMHERVRIQILKTQYFVVLASQSLKL